MKKILGIIFSIGMILSLVACEEKLDAKAIYTKASETMSQLDSARMDIHMDMSLKGAEDDASSFTIPMDMVFIGVDMQSEAPSIYIENSVTFLGSTSSLKQWTIDGVTYTDQDGSKYTQEASVSIENSNFDVASSFSDIEDFKATREENGYLLTANIKSDEIESLFGEMFESLEGLSAMTINDPISLKIHVDESDHISAMELLLTLSVDGVGDMDMEAAFDYSEFDSAVLPELNKEEFIDYSTANDAVYGQYDLTKDHVDALMSKGYALMGDDIYYDGNYFIDLNYKQFYDGSMVYDWEYDQGYMIDEDINITCQYNFLDGSSDGECDSEALTSLRQAYNDLASSILQAQ